MDYLNLPKADITGDIRLAINFVSDFVSAIFLYVFLFCHDEKYKKLARFLKIDSSFLTNIIIFMTTQKLHVSKPVEIRLRKRLKRVFQPKDPDKLGVVIVEIWDVKKGEFWDMKYVVSFGGKKSITIHGEDDWKDFVDLIDEADFLAETTQEIRVIEKEKGE